jgi:hypothetical protein
LESWNIEEINESKSQQMVLEVRSIVFYLLYPITILMCLLTTNSHTQANKSEYIKNAAEMWTSLVAKRAKNVKGRQTPDLL